MIGSDANQQLPAIDGDHAAGHEAPRVRGQQQQWPVQIGQIAKAAHRYARDHLLAGLGFEEAGVDLGREIAGAMALTRIPSRASSSAIDRVRLSTAALEVQ